MCSEASTGSHDLKGVPMGVNGANMLKSLRVVLLIFSLSAASYAQKPTEITVSGLEIEVVDASFSGGNVGRFKVTDESRIPVVAMHFRYGCDARVKQTPIVDFLVSERYQTSIGSLKTYTTLFMSADILNCPGGVDAAIFADGHSEGDPKSIADIYSWRKGVYKGITYVMPLLSKIVQPESETEQPNALVAITHRESAIRQDRSSNMHENQGEFFLIGAVADSLVKEQPFGIPSDSTQFKGPDVDQVIKTEHLDHSRASAFVLRRKLLEWQHDLEGNLNPQPNMP